MIINIVHSTAQGPKSMTSPPGRFSPAFDGVCMHVCMYGHTYSKSSMDQPGKVANPVRGQLNRENSYFPVRVRA